MIWGSERATLAPAFTRIESLLVVDDSAVQRAHTVALCHALGISLVYEAANGDEALELLSLLILPPSLMIIDLEMPGMDGIELIEELHQRRIRIPLIVASMRENALIHAVETMANALDLHVLAALQKPLTQDRLGSALAHFRELPPALLANAADTAAPIDKTELARALAGNEIIAYYQPKVDIRTGLARGVEALARWMHPRHGMIAPDRFIPLAEEQGLIHGLTMAIMDQALAQAALWNARGLKLSMAINLSARLLDSPGLVQEIAGLQAFHGVPPGQIVLEITESSVVAHFGAALGILARLRLKGFGLSIDDYGTGFSSMQQLARIPFTELKIDRSFVHGAHQRNNLRVILQSALDMAHRLQLVTVAEGIETLEDWHLLSEFGCSIGQGYLIAKPMPAVAIPQWLHAHHDRLHELRAKPPVHGVAGVAGVANAANCLDAA